MEQNRVLRIKELITEIGRADEAYYRDDAPVMTDREYDALIDELRELERITGIVFANSPTRRVGGANKAELQKVTHTKPMLSAAKTKSADDIIAFAAGKRVIFSRKMDGLTLVLRYKGGNFMRAITRGEDGLVGEDVTHAVRYLRNIPKKVGCKEEFEVRGEGVISWADLRVLNRGDDHPRNIAAGAVRAVTPDKGALSHIDFFAFELIMPKDRSKTKEKQLDFLAGNGFDVVEHTAVKANCGGDEIRSIIKDFCPEKCYYPVDGIIAEYDDIAFGRSLGATAHHENRMIAFKWEDRLYETVFRGVEPAVTRSGKITLSALFDPVMIDGARVERADLNSLAGFERLELGIGDTIKVYKANMIIPQIAENLTRSGTYALPESCPCCGSRLELRVSPGGSRSLWCPNEECIARNAQKIARFCDKDAMNMEGFTASAIENLMAFGFVKSYADLYNLEKHKDRIITTPGFGCGSYERMVTSAENSRRCHLARFLVGVGIPLMTPAAAKEIDEYFCGSWDLFEKAVCAGFSFFHIDGVSQALSRNIYGWYGNKTEEKLWRPVLKEITFIGRKAAVGESGNPFANAGVAVTGTVNGMNRRDIAELLKLLGAEVSDTVTKNTTYLIVGERPGAEKLSAALAYGTAIVTERHFARMLAESELTDGEQNAKQGGEE